MTQPLILSTWTFGQAANAAAWPALGAGGSSLDAVEAAARFAEDDPANPTVGTGGRPDASGRVSLDACIMTSPARCGAVAAVRRIGHPITAARRLMESSRHKLLVGPDADDFALAHHVPEATLLTPQARAEWQKWRETGAETPLVPNIEESARSANHDTIGILALDSAATLAGACTTSGLAWKLPGRVGDSPTIGHGLYVEPAIGAAVATGHGELIMSVCGSFLAIELLRHGATPLDAAKGVLKRIVQANDLTEKDQVGIIVLDARGNWAGASLRTGFRIAVRTPERDELAEPTFIFDQQ